MTKLLVSVRSAVEAEAALAGGASIIDVKEPLRGSLGRADCSIWRQVRDVLPPEIPLSIALGELNEWFDSDACELPRDCWSGIHLRKLGLADAGLGWSDRWRRLRNRWAGDEHDPSRNSGVNPGWVAVVYLDWGLARAPDPDSVIRAAASIEGCTGVLFDTWDKSRRTEFDPSWERQIARVRETGRFVALAGSLDEAAIRRLRPLQPEIFAVRGAACQNGDRRAPIDPERVARLAELVGE